MPPLWYYTILMAENTVFQSPGVTNQPVGLPTAQVRNVVPPPHRVFPLDSIIKIIIGLMVVVFILFIIFGFIIPLFRKSSTNSATITFWGLWEDNSIIQPILDDFKRQYPNITVNYVKEDVKQYRDRLSTRIQNGTGPDVFEFHNTWLPQLSNTLLPLPSDTISKKDFENSFYPVAQNDLIKNGAIYGIPLEVDTLSLYVNTQIFQAAGVKVPDNWDDFSRVARSLTVIDENGKIKTAGAALGTFDNINHAPDIISLLLIQNGADINNLNATSKNASDALTFYTSFATGNQKVWDETLDPSLLAFAKGELGMYFGYSWDFFTIKALNPSLTFQIYPVPHLPGRNMTVASYWSAAVSIKSQHQKEALTFIKFLSKPETEEKLFALESKTRVFGEPYAIKSLADKLQGNSFVFPFVSAAKNAASSFFASGTYDDGLNSQMDTYLGNAVRSMLDNDTSADSAVATLSQGVSQVLKQYEQQ